jgi:hypothetical protein
MDSNIDEDLSIIMKTNKTILVSSVHRKLVGYNSKIHILRNYENRKNRRWTRKIHWFTILNKKPVENQSINQTNYSIFEKTARLSIFFSEISNIEFSIKLVRSHFRCRFGFWVPGYCWTHLEQIVCRQHLLTHLHARMCCHWSMNARFSEATREDFYTFSQQLFMELIC